MAQRSVAQSEHDPPDSPGLRVALGSALQRRAEGVATEVMRTAQDWSWRPGHPLPAELEMAAAIPRLATEVIGRGLTGGEGATEAEHSQLGGAAVLIEAIDLPGMVKPYLAWRDAAA